MEPAAAVSAVKTAGDLTVQYGIQVVVCFVVIGIFCAILRWVFRFMDKLVNDTLSKVTNNLASLTVSNDQAHANHVLMFERISKDVKDGFDSLRQGNLYQRDEHKDLKAAELDTRKEILAEIRSLADKVECKAK